MSEATTPEEQSNLKNKQDKELLEEYELDDLDALAQERLALAEMGDDYE